MPPGTSPNHARSGTPTGWWSISWNKRAATVVHTLVTDFCADLPVARGPSLGLGWGLGLLTALASVAAAISVLSIQWHGIITSVVLSAAALTVGFLAARFVLGFIIDQRRSLVAGLTMLGFAPLLASAASQAFADSALRSTLSPPRIAGAVALAIPCFVVVGALARSLSNGQRRRSDRVLSTGALLALVGSLLLAGQAWLDRVGVFSAVGPTPSRVAVMQPALLGDGRFFEQRPNEADLVASSFSLGRCCIGNRCFAYVGHAAAVRVIGPTFPQEATVELLHSDQRSELILMADGHMIAVAADDLAAGAWTVPTAATAARMHVPRSFGVLAAVAFFGALLMLAWRFRLSRGLAKLVAARAGLLRSNGWLEVEGDWAPRRSLWQVEPGPVLLTDSSERHSNAYRGDCGDREVALVAGTRQALTLELGDRIATANALILGWVVPLSAPAAAAAALALLG